ncbi:MAG: MFS transporter [Candidatus Omnitrophica bacterium]|nr:MFS transporter [Candidatus Omnitrophota bacterium]
MQRPIDFFPNHPFLKSLDVSWKEGIAAGIMVAIMDEYLIPFGLFLGATPLDIGFLVAIPHLLGSLSQFLAVKIVDHFGSRLRFLSQATLFQAFLLVPMAFLSVLTFPSRILALIFLVTLFRVLANLIATLWGSLMSDYLPPEDRGKYFGWRSRLVGLFGVAALLFAATVLYFFKKFSLPAFGFTFVFLVIAASRLVSSRLMAQMQDAPHLKQPGDEFTFFMFLRRMRKSNFVKFTLYVGSITFATTLAAPYFSVYMLQELKFNYLVYTFVHMGAVVAGLFSFPVWGKQADRVGNAKVLKTTSLFIPLIPVLWLFSNNLLYLFLIEVFAGFVWGGFNLCSVNFIYDAVSPGKRVRCLSYFSFIMGTMTFLGASLGGYLAERLPPLNGSRILSLFLLSAVLRYLSHFFLSRHFQEVRQRTQPVSSLELFFSVISMRMDFEKIRDWGLLFGGKKSGKS